MKRLVLGVVLAAFVALNAHAGDTVRIGSKVISVGDGVGKVVQIAGNPDRTEPVENKYGAKKAERYEYFRDNKTIQITIEAGKVVAIQEIR